MEAELSAPPSSIYCETVKIMATAEHLSCCPAYRLKRIKKSISHPNFTPAAGALDLIDAL